jgi:hypothetical protein
MFNVQIACNDDNGNQTGKIDAIQIEGIAEFEGDALSYTPGRWPLIEGLRVQSHGEQHWVGNWCWDAIRLDLEDTNRLLFLLHRNHWSIIEGDWALFQAYDRGCDCLAALEGVVNNAK